MPANQLQRTALFFKERFPLFPHFLLAFFTFVSLYTSAQVIAGSTAVTISLLVIPGTLTFFLMLMLMRVYDELKDVETDLRLGNAGDPRYKDRPIVTGALKVSDLTSLRWGITAAVIAVNLLLGWPHPLFEFVLLFSFMLLSYHWFFYPAMKDNLLIALATHNPIALFFAFYVIGVYFADNQGAPFQPTFIWIMVGSWAFIACWEISRKIRLPEDETDYETYSKAFGGWRRAVIFSAIASVAGTLSWSWAFMSSGFTGLCFFLLLPLALYQWRSFQALSQPTAERVKLQPYSELFMLLSLVIITLYVGITNDMQLQF